MFTGFAFNQENSKNQNNSLFQGNGNQNINTSSLFQGNGLQEVNNDKQNDSNPFNLQESSKIGSIFDSNVNFLFDLSARK